MSNLFSRTKFKQTWRRKITPLLSFCFDVVCYEMKKIILNCNIKSNRIKEDLKMVHPCIVSGCKNKAKDGIYRFPRDLELRRKWLEVKIRMLQVYVTLE